MFISKIKLSDHAGSDDMFWKVFGSEYSLHQAVWNLFADNPDRRRDFLYRLDTVGKQPVIYAISERKPEPIGKLWNIETKQYKPQVLKNMRLGFTVRVNPTCKLDGKRHDVVMNLKHKMRLDSGEHENKALPEIVTAACEQWFNERSAKNGFKILSMRADGYRQMRFNKSKGGVPVRYSTVDLTGAIEVIDEQLFKPILLDGIGPEKGFGCGLMLVRKI